MKPFSLHEGAEHVKLEKFERDCPHNKKINAGTEKGRIIKDVAITDNGKVVAYFAKELSSHDYILVDKTYRRILLPTAKRKHAREIKCRFIPASMISAYIDARDMGLIPTDAQMEQLRIERIQVAKQEELEMKNRQYKAAVEAAAPELLKLLTGMLESYDVVMENSPLPEMAKDCVRGAFLKEPAKARQLLASLPPKPEGPQKG